jgi:hypothetical protein
MIMTPNNCPSLRAYIVANVKRLAEVHSGIDADDFSRVLDFLQESWGGAGNVDDAAVYWFAVGVWASVRS